MFNYHCIRDIPTRIGYEQEASELSALDAAYSFVRFILIPCLTTEGQIYVIVYRYRLKHEEKKDCFQLSTPFSKPKI